MRAQQKPALLQRLCHTACYRKMMTHGDDVVRPSNGARCSCVAAAATTGKAVAQRCRLMISPQ